MDNVNRPLSDAERTLISHALLHEAERITSLGLNNIEVYVRVPGGGDWSNTNLDVDEKCPILIEWTETSVIDSPGED